MIADSILQHYELSPNRVEYLGGAGGFSGAQLWKFQSGSQAYCLRRWPAVHPDCERLEWINLVLVHVAINGLSVVPVPLTSNSGERFVAQGEFLWEVAPWMPGAADFEADPNDDRLNNVAQTVAKFHLASAQVNLDFRKSPNARSRFNGLRESGEWIERLKHTQPSVEMPAINFLRELILKLGVAESKRLGDLLKPFVDDTFPVQPVIRDLWHDHVLFSGNEVTGIVDFGAMQMDNVALDLSRVLGSLVGDQRQRWESAFETYSELRALQPREIEFAFVLDQCSSFLGSLNWLKWILIDQRSFESLPDVERRIQSLTRRLID